jgi:hypothetical protein
VKLELDARFPHPVLTSDADDYLAKGIDWNITAKEVPSTGAVQLEGDLDVLHPGFLALIHAGKLASGLQVVCLDTYYIRFHKTGTGNISLRIEPGALLGSVSVRPMLFAVEDLELPSEGMNPEYGDSPIAIVAGDVAGYGDEAKFVVGLEKLAPLESIFTLVRNPEIEESRFELDSSGQTVKIHVSSRLFDELEAIRGTATVRNVLLSAVYLPCIIELLSIAASDPPSDARWFRVFSHRCEHLHLKLDGKDLAKTAQSLLGNPLGLLAPVFGATT